MKFSEIVKRFKGDREQRAREEFRQIGKSIADGPDGASIDAEKINSILDASGQTAEELDRQVHLHRTRAGVRAELATAEDAIRESQANKDRAVAASEKLEAQLAVAQVEALRAQDGHRLLSQRFADHRAFITATAPAELRQRLNAARDRAVQIGLQATDLQRRLKQCERMGRSAYDQFTDAHAVAFVAEHTPTLERMKAEESAAQLEVVSLEQSILNA